MHSKPLKVALTLGVAAALMIAVPAAAVTAQTPSGQCGGDGHNKKKDVKKPTGDDKKPTNPA